jgi:hypothetical protein
MDGIVLHTASNVVQDTVGIRSTVSVQLFFHDQINQRSVLRRHAA